MASTRRDGIARRDALLDAALACFAELGVYRVGIEEIRKRAGASPSSVYHFFGGIEDLTIAVLVRTFERLFRHLAERVTGTRTPKASVMALVEGHIDWILANPEEGRFMYEATALELGANASTELAARKAEMLAPIVTHLEAFIAEGSLPSWPPVVFDVVLLGPSHEALRRLLAGAPLDAAWLRATLPELAWKSVAPARARRRRAR